MLKVGLLGFGFMGVTHYQIYQDLPGVQVVGIFDFDPEKVKQGDIAAGNIDRGESKLDLGGVEITGSADELIGADDIDIIDICLPTYVHADFTVQALDAGKHVFCEKPMALHPSGCERMLEARDRSGQLLMIGQCIRFWPEYAYTRKLIEEKKYGEVISAFFRRLSPAPAWTYENWILQEEKSGGALLDLHIHDIDYILNAFGKVREVRSCGKQNITSAGSGIDYVLTQYITESPALIMAEGGWHFHSQFPFNMSFHVRCEKGTVVFDAGKQETLAIYTECGKTHIPPFSGITGWDEELKYFVNCVESGECTEASPPEESKAAVEIALMERESIRENNPMNIP